MLFQITLLVAIVYCLPTLLALLRPVMNSNGVIDKGNPIQKLFRETTGSLLSKGIPYLDSINSQGKAMIEAKSLPHGKDEAWRHLNLRKLFAHNYRKISVDYTTGSNLASIESNISEMIDENCENSCIVFINGKFAPSISRMTNIPSSVIAGGVECLSKVAAQSVALRVVDNVEIPDQSEQPRDSFGSDIVSYLNMANAEDVACIYVPSNVKMNFPLQILFCNTANLRDNDEPSDSTVSYASYPRLAIELGDGANLQLKTSYCTIPVECEPMKGSDKTVIQANLVGCSTHIELSENSHLEHTYMQNLAASSRHLEVLTSNIRGNASYDLAAVQNGATIGRMNVHMNLLDSSANCSLHGVTLAGPRQSLDIHSSITHGAPEAISRQQQRNVIADRGEAIFKGRIRVPQQAQLTDSDQLCRSIMLGNRARVIAMPTLEITADNVECSHGASVTDLDENSMFYLASRGVNRLQARKLLLRGFVFDLLNERLLGKKDTDILINKIENMFRASSIEPGADTFKSVQKLMSI